jgi:branched-chain amino acid transport system permease protein
MSVSAQLLLNSLQIGAVYVLFAMGLTIIFGVMRIVNFAHGEFFTLCALIIAVSMPWLVKEGFPLWAAYGLAFVLGLGAVTLLSVVIFRFGFMQFQRDMIGSFILSIGLVLLLQGVYLDVFGGIPRVVPPVVEGTYSIMGATITGQRLLLCAIALLITVALYWMLTHTKLGKGLRAIAEDHEAAMLQGIPYRRITLYGFLIGSLLAAIAGGLIAPVSVPSPMIGADYLIKGFIAVIIGGLGSISGAILGSALIAVIESIGGYYFDPSTATIAMFVLVMLVLIVRPRGILGHA